MTTIQDILHYDQDLLFSDPWYPASDDLTILKAARWDDAIETIIIPGTAIEYCGHHALIGQAVKAKCWKWHELVVNESKQLNGAKAWDKQYGRGKLTYQDFRKNKEHIDVGIALHEEITVTCEETGISFVEKCPIPTALQTKLNLPTLHFLAFPENIKEVMYHYNKTGIAIEKELSNQVLAGMLLTILRAKGLLICRDAQKANKFLSGATKETLGFMVRSFHRLQSAKGMPGLSLDLADSERLGRANDPESFLLCYYRACKGESTEDNQAHISVKITKEKTVKVYGDPLIAQIKTADYNEKKGLQLIAKLVSEYPGQHSLFFGTVKNTLKMLSFASEKLRKDLAKKLRETFPTSQEAKDIATIFDSTKQDAIEDDLFSFTQQTKKQRENAAQLNDLFVSNSDKPKKVKVDFLSKLNSKG